MLQKKIKIKKIKRLPSDKLNLSEPSPECLSRLNRSSNAQLTEFRTEEHHEERVGTNIL